MLDQSSVAGMAVAERFYVRRTFLKLMGLVPMVAAGADGANSTEAAKPLVKPRHVLCFLGGEHALAGLADAASAAINDFATGFGIDHTYSLDEAYPQMSRSFEVCWDRVQANAWTSADEEAVANHKASVTRLSQADLVRHCGQHTRRGRCQCLLLTAEDHYFEVKEAVVQRLLLSGPAPLLQGANADIRDTKPDNPAEAWRLVLEDILRVWV